MGVIELEYSLSSPVNAVRVIEDKYQLSTKQGASVPVGCYFEVEEFEAL